MASSSAAERLTLYVDAFWQSPFDCSCYVTLREKGLAFSTSNAMVREGHMHDEVLRRAIVGRVPALQHGAHWLSESMAIIEYLEEAFPSPLYPRVLPADVRDRSRARQIMMWLRTSLYRLRRDRPTSVIFYGHSVKPMAPDAVVEANELISVAERLIGAGRETLFEQWSVADADLTFTLMRIIRAGDAVPMPVVDYAETNWRRPSVREYAGHPRPPHPPV